MPSSHSGCLGFLHVLGSRPLIVALTESEYSASAKLYANIYRFCVCNNRVIVHCLVYFHEQNSVVTAVDSNIKTSHNCTKIVVAASYAASYMLVTVSISQPTILSQFGKTSRKKYGTQIPKEMHILLQ